MRNVLRWHIVVAPFNNCIFLDLRPRLVYHSLRVNYENWDHKQNHYKRNDSTNDCSEFIFSLVSQLNRFSVDVYRSKSVFESFFEWRLILMLYCNQISFCFWISEGLWGKIFCEGAHEIRLLMLSLFARWRFNNFDRCFFIEVRVAVKPLRRERIRELVFHLSLIHIWRCRRRG